MRHPKTPLPPSTWWSCTRKVRYAKSKSAKKAIRRLDNLDIRYYNCKLCGGFHITKKKIRW